MDTPVDDARVAVAPNCVLHRRVGLHSQRGQWRHRGAERLLGLVEPRGRLLHCAVQSGGLAGLCGAAVPKQPRTLHGTVRRNTRTTTTTTTIVDLVLTNNVFNEMSIRLLNHVEKHSKESSGFQSCFIFFSSCVFRTLFCGCWFFLRRLCSVFIAGLFCL